MYCNLNLKFCCSSCSSYLHAKNIIHRDLKSNSILFTIYQFILIDVYVEFGLRDWKSMLSLCWQLAPLTKPVLHRLDSIMNKWPFFLNEDLMLIVNPAKSKPAMWNLFKICLKLCNQSHDQTKTQILLH
jgi:serine/threonine protein kinase